MVVSCQNTRPSPLGGYVPVVRINEATLLICDRRQTTHHHHHHQHDSLKTRLDHVEDVSLGALLDDLVPLDVLGHLHRVRHRLQLRLRQT